MIAFAAAIAAALILSHRSGSTYIVSASRILAIIFAGSLILFFTGKGVWRYAVLELLAFGYFFVRWSAPDAQHRQFHFFLMACYVITTGYYTYMLGVRRYLSEAFGLSSFYFQLLHNLTFIAEILLVIGYAILYRRARADKAKYYADIDGWFAKAAAAKRGVSDAIRQALPKSRKR